MAAIAVDEPLRTNALRRCCKKTVAKQHLYSFVPTRAACRLSQVNVGERWREYLDLGQITACATRAAWTLTAPNPLHACSSPGV